MGKILTDAYHMENKEKQDYYKTCVVVNLHCNLFIDAMSFYSWPNY